VTPGELTIFWTAVAAYMVVVVAIGAWSYRRTAREEGFLVAGRRSWRTR
jgi:Na+/proline symporter